MTDSDSTEREDPMLQADPVLSLSDGRATFGQKLFSVIAGIIVVLGTLYGLVHKGESPPSTASFQVSVVMPNAVGQTK